MPEIVAQQNFLDKYQVLVSAPGQVRLVMPANGRVIGILEDAQAIARGLYNLDAVWPSRLAAWASDGRFRAALTKASSLLVVAAPPETTWKTRDEQEQLFTVQNRTAASLVHVAAAHSCYFIATGKDLFDGRILRTRDGESVYYGDGGLSLMNSGDFIDNCRYQHVAMPIEEVR